MSLTLTDLKDVINDCIEDGKLISIMCDLETATIVEEYLDDMGLAEKHNVICDYIPFGHRNSIYNISIDCTKDYEYYIDFYKLNENLSCEYDEVHVIGNELYEFNIESVDANHYVVYGDMEIEEDDLDNITYEDECCECCLDCEYPDEDCDMDNCECDECLECRDNDEIDEESDVKMPCECPQCDENRLLIDYAERILFTNGCPECVMDIVMELSEHMKHVGWEDHKEYMIEQLCDEE